MSMIKHWSHNYDLVVFIYVYLQNMLFQKISIQKHAWKQLLNKIIHEPC